MLGWMFCRRSFGRTNRRLWPCKRRVGIRLWRRGIRLRKSHGVRIRFYPRRVGLACSSDTGRREGVPRFLGRHRRYGRGGWMRLRVRFQSRRCWLPNFPRARQCPGPRRVVRCGHWFLLGSVRRRVGFAIRSSILVWKGFHRCGAGLFC